MNDDYYRRRIGPVNMFLSIISGWISGISGLHNIPFLRHWLVVVGWWEERRAANADGRGRRRQQWGQTLVLLSSCCHRRGWALKASS